MRQRCLPPQRAPSLGTGSAHSGDLTFLGWLICFAHFLFDHRF